MHPFLDPLTPLATVAVAAAEGKKTAASVDSRWVGELFQAVGTLAERLAVGAVREAATVLCQSIVSSPCHGLWAASASSFFRVPSLLVILVVLGHDAGGQGGDEDGEILHFVCKRKLMSAQQILQDKDRIVIIMDKEAKWMGMTE